LKWSFITFFLVVIFRFFHVFKLFRAQQFNISNFRLNFSSILKKLKKIWLISVNQKAEVLKRHQFLSLPVRLRAEAARLFNRHLFEIIDSLDLIYHNLFLKISGEFTLRPSVRLRPEHKCVNMVVAQPAFLISFGQHAPLPWARKLLLVPKLPLKNQFVDTVRNCLLRHISFHQFISPYLSHLHAFLQLLLFLASKNIILLFNLIVLQSDLPQNLRSFAADPSQNLLLQLGWNSWIPTYMHWQYSGGLFKWLAEFPNHRFSQLSLR
jgi:hypothetical protein